MEAILFTELFECNCGDNFINIYFFCLYRCIFNPIYLFNLSRTAAVYAFIGASQLILMVIGDMNLGIGACGALSTVVMGTLITKFGLPILPAVLMAVLVSVLCGLMIGLLVVKMKLNPWIITLAMSFVFNGLAIGYSHGYSYEMPETLTWIGRTKLGIFSFFVYLDGSYDSNFICNVSTYEIWKRYFSRWRKSNSSKTFWY